MTRKVEARRRKRRECPAADTSSLLIHLPVLLDLNDEQCVQYENIIRTFAPGLERDYNPGWREIVAAHTGYLPVVGDPDTEADVAYGKFCYAIAALEELAIAGWCLAKASANWSNEPVGFKTGIGLAALMHLEDCGGDMGSAVSEAGRFRPAFLELIALVTELPSTEECVRRTAFRSAIGPMPQDAIVLTFLPPPQPPENERSGPFALAGTNIVRFPSPAGLVNDNYELDIDAMSG
jgi:hypothetical protein